MSVLDQNYTLDLRNNLHKLKGQKGKTYTNYNNSKLIGPDGQPIKSEIRSVTERTTQ